MKLKTGFGVLVQNNKKLRKFELAPGSEHDFPMGFSVMEVASRAELDAIVLDKSDEQIAYEAKLVNQQNLKASARAKLKTALNLTDDEMNALFGA